MTQTSSLYLRQARPEDEGPMRRLNRYRPHLTIEGTSIAFGLEAPWPGGLSERFRSDVVVCDVNEVVARALLGYAPDLMHAQALMHGQLNDRVSTPVMRVINQVLEPNNEDARLLLHFATLKLAQRLGACLIRDPLLEVEDGRLIIPIGELLSPEQRQLMTSLVSSIRSFVFSVGVVPRDAITASVETMAEILGQEEVVWQGEEPFTHLVVQ